MVEEIKRKFPFPFVRPDFRPFRWKLDGGGRELITELLDRADVKSMLEIGVLYGGSALQWLEHKKDLYVVGVDPWEFDEEQIRYWWKNRFAYGLHNLDQAGIPDDEFLEQILRPDAAFLATISNLWEYRDRFTPVRARSPEILGVLCRNNYAPDLIYFDSDKKLSDLQICRTLWPSSILSGDDWTWRVDDESDTYPVQDLVNQFAGENSMKVFNSDATWYLWPKENLR